MAEAKGIGILSMQSRGTWGMARRKIEAPISNASASRANRLPTSPALVATTSATRPRYSGRSSAHQAAPHVKQDTHGANGKLKLRESETSKAIARKYFPEAQATSVKDEVSNPVHRPEIQVAPSAADSVVWQGTVDDALLLAIQALSSSSEANLSTLILAEIVF